MTSRQGVESFSPSGEGVTRLLLSREKETHSNPKRRCFQPFPTPSSRKLTSPGCCEGFKLGCFPWIPHSYPGHPQTPVLPSSHQKPQTENHPKPNRTQLPSPEPHAPPHLSPQLCASLGTPSRPWLPDGAPQSSGAAALRCVSTAGAASSSRPRPDQSLPALRCAGRRCALPTGGGAGCRGRLPSSRAPRPRGGELCRTLFC